ncbi:unnamed protein product [Rotaria socialis]|uniref:RBR-type E3 ubiquitin transferase n=1 Tax=Rotaria socialis TaxID=392032 RepID=A0A817Y1S4_9BILA|nr:unnamed protein product [Rotaria socialis]CAF4605393.1 unnamed protein product [Rotaria socialis]
MPNSEKQAEEILALESIFDHKFHLFNEHQYEILIEFDLPTTFTIRFNDKISLIQYLPPLFLIINYHDEYPSDEPPSFILSCFYFSKIDLIKLCQKIDEFSFIPGEVCVYDWIVLIKQEITNEFIIGTDFMEQENDPRALNGYIVENAEKIFQNLIEYNQRREDDLFRNQLQTCSICTDIIPGIDCIRLHRCGHFYCRSCLNNYIRITFENGKFGENLHCPENQCRQALLPTEVKQAIQNDELYERYERLTLQHGLESMEDIVWCPRCQSPVVSGPDSDNLAVCGLCRYTFCKKCKEIFHSQTMCSKDYLIEQMKLQREKERQRLKEERDAALAQINKTQTPKESLKQQQIAKQRYCQIVIKLSEQDSLLREILTAERINLQGIQYCSHCHVPIEKNGGCSHMHCTRCNNDFTWQLTQEPTASIIAPYLENEGHMEIESLKEEFNKAASLGWYKKFNLLESNGKRRSMVIWLLFLSFSSIFVDAAHFNGGTITWTPINSNSNSSPVAISITQTYSWSYPLITCTTNVPVSSGKGDTNLTCIANCSTDGGYSSAPIDILTDCISASSTLGMMTSERTVNITLNIGAYFYIAYQGSAWRSLYNTTSSPDWSIATLIDLRLRSDGIFNTPPVANVLSPQYVIVNTTNLINIPVSDVNVGDDLRCRWAINGIVNECSSICYPGALPNNTILSNCTLSFMSIVPGVWYSVALQVEDFINTTSNSPMSSVPVQFLIYVQPTPVCSIAPVMIPLTDCLEVQTNVSTNFTLYIMNLCNSSATITEVIQSQTITGMTATSVKNSTTNISLAYITLSWTPQTSQIGTQKLCVYAYNSLVVRSTQYCAIFTVTASTPNCPATTIAATPANTTASTNKATSSINIPLVVGLSLLGLLLALCCCFCWLYYFCRNSRGQPRRKKTLEETEAQNKYSKLPESFFSRNFPLKRWVNNHGFHKMANKQDRMSSLKSSSSKSLLWMSIGERSFTTAGNNESHNLSQSFAPESSQSSVPVPPQHGSKKIPRNKISAVSESPESAANQRKQIINHLMTLNSSSADIKMQRVNVSVHHDDSLNAMQMSGNKITRVGKSDLKQKRTPSTSKRRRSVSINHNNNSQEIVEPHAPRTKDITVTRIKDLRQATPLHYACSFNRTNDIVRYLLLKADSYKFQSNKLKSIRDSISNKTSLPMNSKIDDINAKTTDGYDAFSLARIYNNQKILEELFQHIPYDDFQWNERDKIIFDQIYQAISDEDFRVIDSYPIWLVIDETAGETPLHNACKLGCPIVVLHLLHRQYSDNKIEANIIFLREKQNGFTPILSAASADQLKYFERMLNIILKLIITNNSPDKFINDIFIDRYGRSLL